MTADIVVLGKAYQEERRTSIEKVFCAASGWRLFTGITPESCLLFQKQNLTQMLLMITCHFAQIVGPMLAAGHWVARSKSNHLS